MEDDPSCVRITKWPPKWAWPWSRDPISKLWDPLITFEWIKLSALNLVQRWKTHPFCVWITKWPTKWAWPGSCDLISKFRDPLITFERIKLSASNLVHKSRMQTSSVRNTNWHLSRCGRGHLIQFRKFMDPYNFWTDRDIRFKFGIQIKDEHFLRMDHKLIWVGGTDWQNSKRKSQAY